MSKLSEFKKRLEGKILPQGKIIKVPSSTNFLVCSVCKKRAKKRNILNFGVSGREKQIKEVYCEDCGTIYQKEN